MLKENIYRSHNTSMIDESLVGKAIRVAGWVDTIRDHGGITFLDMRDHYGTLQVVFNSASMLSGIKKEQTVSIAGKIRLRDKETFNAKISTGTVELVATEIEVLGDVIEQLPFEINSNEEIREDLRLKYRYLDLRNKNLHDRIVLRSKIISHLRGLMQKHGFLEITTPILTASSPEGARDYLVPSRKHKGKFYALPQAPQIFKQILMVSGFDRYFQIAPCFRDEDARADRAPGEFYQLDFEMSFATQEDVLNVAEEVLYDTFKTFSNLEVSKPPFKRFTYKEAMLHFGTDKPDLRNPLRIKDLSDFFSKCTFKPFQNSCVRAIKVENGSSLSKKFHAEMLSFATSIGMGGLGYITVNDDLSYKGPIDKFIPDAQKIELREIMDLKAGDLLFFIADDEANAAKYAGQIRTELGERLDLIDRTKFEFCYIVDFPMYELDEDGKWAFTHNPFSMPQGGLKALMEKEPDEILAYQYDIVCNGVELSSGAVRNHEVETMIKAFEIAGYSKEILETKFTSLYTAFKFGAPPHAGMAPGIDRIVMLLTNQNNIREVIAFPMNKSAQDLMMGAPSEVTEQQLREIHIKIR
ncbi:MAG TPA: aspartate--tRNA ligase [Clostridiales bacterium]|nr:aspartate--tRNA ligase [Clostridiales bacterium]